MGYQERPIKENPSNYLSCSRQQGDTSVFINIWLVPFLEDDQYHGNSEVPCHGPLFPYLGDDIVKTTKNLQMREN